MAQRPNDGSGGARTASAYSAAICLLLLGLFYYWFAVANRYHIFLYGHLGAEPFDEVTRSRYWMAGLVASGAVMLLYSAANWLAGRVWHGYRPPPAWRVWVYCAMPLSAGILLITMTSNYPTLPAPLALACVAATLAGLALALLPGALAAQRPLELAWLALDGAGLVPALLLLRAIELPGRGLFISDEAGYLVAGGSLLAGPAWLALITMSRITARRRWRSGPWPGVPALLASGLGLNYLLLPLAHHLNTPPAYRYISTAGNFFADSPAVQLLIWLVAIALAAGMTWLRQRWWS